MGVEEPKRKMGFAVRLWIFTLVRPFLASFSALRALCFRGLVPRRWGPAVSALLCACFLALAILTLNPWILNSMPLSTSLFLLFAQRDGLISAASHGGPGAAALAEAAPGLPCPAAGWALLHLQ